jgi:hypothetical protein
MDNCTPPPTVTFVSDVTVNMTCLNRFNVIRTYRATDACGNSATCTQTIVVFDNTPPTITFNNPLLEGVPNGGTIEVQCFGQDPNWEPPSFGAGDVTVMDNCAGTVTVAYDETLVDEGDCDVDGYINRYRLTWTATDACGNSSSAFVFVNLVDTIPPVILGVPADITVDCDEIPEPPMLMAVDECLCACVVELIQDGPDPGCQDGQVVVRTWKATDDCGNMTFESQFITLIDDEGPVLELVDPNVAGLPDGTILDFTCNEGGIPDYFDDLNAESVYSPPVCDGFPNISFNEEIHIADRNCKFFGYIEQRIYTWTGVDACGNDSTHTLTVRLVDTEPPVIIGAPLYTCVGDPSLDDVYAEDNCQDVGVYYWDVPIPNPCGSGTAFRRTWEAVDPCGNYERDTTILIPNDGNPPVVEFIHPDLIGMKDGDVMTMDCIYGLEGYTPYDEDAVSVVDDCPLGVTMSFTETVVLNGDCSDGRLYRILLEWTASDLCGNVVTRFLYVDLVDQTPPVLIDFDSEVTIGCNDELPEILVDDNCGAVEVTITDEIIPGTCVYEYDVIRTIKAMDICGNVTSAIQTVHVGDGSGPIIEGVEEEICDDLSIPDVTAWDPCAEAYVPVTMTQDTLDVPCKDGLVIHRVWTATDICGNVATAEQIIYIDDHTPPEIQIPTWSIILAFLDQEPNLVNLSKESIIDQLNDLDESSVYVVDDCDQFIVPKFSLTVTYSDNCEADGWYEHRVYTWTATDACGNSSVVTFSVSILDDIPPVIEGNFEELTVICAPLPPPIQVQVTDYGTPVDLDYNQVIGPDNGQGEFVVERTWTATDPCGNVTVAKQTILWIPNTFVDCDILLPPAVECNSHGVVIGSDVNGGIGPFTYEWEVIGEKCFIQSGQGTPTITIYVGFSQVLISLTVTDAYGCSGICQATLDCIDPFDDAFQGIPVDIGPNSEEPGVLIPAVNQGKDQLSGLRYWPNPAHATLNLKFTTSTAGEVEIILTNFLGQIVHRDEMDAIKGTNHRKMDVSAIPDGTYLLQVKKDDVIHAKPVVIIHNR